MNIRAFSVPGMLLLVLAHLVLVLPASGCKEQKMLLVGPHQEYETIQAAVDAAKQGSRILVYPDTYTESVAVTKNNLQIIALGKGVVVVPPDTAGFQVDADHVTVQGFEIAYGADCASGIRFEGSHNTFADNYIYLAATCLGVNAISCRDPDGGSDYNIVERNTINGADLGIVIEAATLDAINTGNVIRDNTLLSVAQDPIAIENGKGFLVSGNRITGAPYGICIAVGTEGKNRVAQGHHTIVKNTMDNCGDNGISLYAWPGTVFTHNRIADNTIQNCGGDCLALEAGSGATLTHNEVISNSVSLSMNGSGVLLAADQDAVVSDNAVRDNLVYHNARNGISVTSGADGNRILNNEVQTNNNVGIAVVGDDNLIAGNRAYNNSMDVADLGEGNEWRNNTYTPTVGWAVGDSIGGYGTILHTVDGGATWVRQGSAADVPDTALREVSAIDAQTAWVVGENAILRTRDGGQTWESQTLPSDLPSGFALQGIKALDGNTAYAVGAPSVLLQTTDGATWSFMPRSADVPGNIAFQVVDAVDASHVWAVGATGGRKDPVIAFYDGDEWHVQPTNALTPPTTAVIGISAIDAQHAWAVGGFAMPLATTADGGATWQVTEYPLYPWDMNRVVAANLTTGWAAGDNGTVKYTTDAGENWYDVNLPSSFLFGVTAMSAQAAWVVGPGLPRPPGVIARTIDAQQWEVQSDPSWPNMNGISFVGARR